MRVGKGPAGAQAAALWAGGNRRGQLSTAIKGLSPKSSGMQTPRMCWGEGRPGARVNPSPAQQPGPPAPPRLQGALCSGSRERDNPAPGGEWNAVRPGTKQTRPGLGWISAPWWGWGHRPLVCGAVTCSAPVYVLVFTCGRPGSRNLRVRPTRPAPVGSHRAAPFPHPIRDRRVPCPLWVRAGRLALSLGVQGWPTGRVLSECMCVRVSQVRAWVCARVCGARRRAFSCHFPVRTLRGGPTKCGPPSSPQPLASLEAESSFRSGDVREAGVPAPPPPHHSPSATCASAPVPAPLLLQRAHLLAATTPAP